ncbi:MAG: glycosyl transferase-like protein [Magnetovibrio sp.]|nr:glycosyl transferase-like protein [Magnetovibrio sp.]|tara:strand:+ start:6638 stop:8230 length:1593 start_codon:yes stop_codon:yes gene_type:complete
MGRHAAGESFLRGYIQWSKTEDLYVFVETEQHAKSFQELYGNDCAHKSLHFLSPESIQRLTEPGVMFVPGPEIDGHSYRRQVFGAQSAWSITGITHTTSSAVAMRSVINLLTSPVERWDALICTSNAVKGHVESMLTEQSKFLKNRLGSSRNVMPELPVIPLGIHTKDFVFSEEDRISSRHKLGIEDSEIVVLYTGRLSFHAKAHPLVMYQAIEEAGLAAGQKIVLIESGWHGNEHIAAAFRDGAKFGCPSARVLRLDGRVKEQRNQGWAAADIFCSLPDNVQETFGIVPIEAMAAGLPVVVSDWNGYRDSIRDGLDGYRIPTIMPEEGMGMDLIQRYAAGVDSYDRYCGNTSSLISVDVDATIDAFYRLFSSRELRIKMGQDGQRRAVDVYDWETIIPQYESLWTNLASMRKEQSINTCSNRSPVWLDPFYAFRGYPTTRLGLDTGLKLRHGSLGQSLKHLQSLNALAMVNFAAHVMPSMDEAEKVIHSLVGCEKTVDEILRLFPAEESQHLRRSLVWMLKLGILSRCQ